MRFTTLDLTKKKLFVLDGDFNFPGVLHERILVFFYFNLSYVRLAKKINVHVDFLKNINCEKLFI